MGCGTKRNRPAEVVVFAAASLAQPFQELAATFEREHPGVRVRLALAGSQQLAAQIESGARGDVFASADRRWMERLRARGLVRRPVVFARNRLVVVVPQANPARIEAVADLARPGVKLVLGAAAVPVGAYAREALRRLDALPAYGPGFAERALANLVSEEEDVKAVLGKVQLGEADAGIVYRSDVTGAVAERMRVMQFPASSEVEAVYPIAVLRASRRPDLAAAFVRFVISPRGQSVLGERGLLPRD